MKQVADATCLTMEATFGYFEKPVRSTVWPRNKQVLLLHAKNAINADHFKDIRHTCLQKRGLQNSSRIENWH